jgi:hypothetical protein
MAFCLPSRHKRGPSRTKKRKKRKKKRKEKKRVKRWSPLVKVFHCHRHPVRAHLPRLRGARVMFGLEVSERETSLSSDLDMFKGSMRMRVRGKEEEGEGRDNQVHHPTRTLITPCSLTHFPSSRPPTTRPTTDTEPALRNTTLLQMSAREIWPPHDRHDRHDRVCCPLRLPAM